jgi:pimeloyl-ACP methyl ester carboxylesterase
MIADRCSRVAAVVLCASFIESPLPVSFVRPPRFLWNRPPSITLLRLLLTGGDRKLADSVRRAIAAVPADVIADRVGSVLKVSVREELEALAAPLLCLRATRDRIVSARCTEKMRAAKPHAEFADVDAPHLLLQSSPAAAWALIEPFLSRAENVDIDVG